MTGEEVKIIAEPNLDPHFCKITVLNRDVLPGKIFNCASAEDAKGSPLMEAFFTLGGIEKVMVAGNSFTFQKGGTNPWPPLAKQIGVAIRTAFAAGASLFPEEFEEKFKSSLGPEEGDLTTPDARLIQDLLETQINPAIASHGGRISLIDVKEDTVYLRMEGGCQGCGMAKMTLSQGVETLIKKNLPHINQVLDVTDHAQGNNPYYQPSKK